MVSVITWQTIYLNGIIHSFDLAKANMHVAEEKSVTHKTQNTRRAFLCVTDKRDNCSTYFLPDRKSTRLNSSHSSQYRMPSSA